MDIKLEPVADGVLTSTLDQWEKRLAHMAPAFAAIYQDFQNIEKERFNTVGRGSGISLT